MFKTLIFWMFLVIFGHFPALAITSGFTSLCRQMPKNIKKPLGLKQIWQMQRGRLEAPGWEDKKVTTQSGRQRAPKAFAKNIHFPDRFCNFCSSGSIWWPLPARPSFSKWAKKHCVYRYFEKSRRAILRPQDGETKTWPPKVDAKEPLRHLRKTFIFFRDFAFFALRGPFGGRSRRARHFQNK